MTLSSSTLNLKFMQRAAAIRNANASAQNGESSTQAEPLGAASEAAASTSTPTRSGIPPASAKTGSGQDSSSIHIRDPMTPMSIAGPSTPGSEASSALRGSTGIGLQAEQEAQARWHMPLRSRPPGAISTRGSTESTVTFETSYMPFLTSASDGADGNEGASGSRTYSSRAGGGRMVFGGFGEAAKDTEEAVGEGSEDDDGESGSKGKKRRMETGGGSRLSGGKTGSGSGRMADLKRERTGDGRRRDIGVLKNRQSPPEHITSKGFARPSNFDADLHTKSTPTSSSSTPMKKRQHVSDTLGPNANGTRMGSGSALVNAISIDHEEEEEEDEEDRKPIIPPSPIPAPKAGTTSTSGESVKKASTADKLRQTITTAAGSASSQKIKTESGLPTSISSSDTAAAAQRKKKRPNGTISPAIPTSTSESPAKPKRVKLELSSQPKPQSQAQAARTDSAAAGRTNGAVSSVSAGPGMDLDAREREAKAAKKREKKARKKEKVRTEVDA